jgi:hypothetical protein
VTGDNPYKFLYQINGLALDSAGYLYVLGQYGAIPAESDHFCTVVNALRKYSPDGTYQKTVYPYPAGKPVSAVSPYGVIALSGNKYAPRTTLLEGPHFGDSISLISSQGALLLSPVRNNEIQVVNYPYTNWEGGPENTILQIMKIDTMGSCLFPAPLALITSPATPALNMYYGPWMAGPVYVTPSPDGKSYFVSGYYRADTSGGKWLAASTGVWRDGQIFRVDRTTGVATQWLALIPFPIRSRIA